MVVGLPPVTAGPVDRAPLGLSAREAAALAGPLLQFLPIGLHSLVPLVVRQSHRLAITQRVVLAVVVCKETEGPQGAAELHRPGPILGLAVLDTAAAAAVRDVLLGEQEGQVALGMPLSATGDEPQCE